MKQQLEMEAKIEKERVKQWKDSEDSKNLKIELQKLADIKEEMRMVSE
jgi:hypothetical protein